MSVIYKAVNKTNGKVYIGYSSDWPRRIYMHLWEAKSKPSKQIFHLALKKYGADQFDWDVLYESTDNDFLLNIMEGYFIRSYQSHYSTGKGYNISFGGEGQIGFRHSGTTIQKFKSRIPWNKGITTGPQSKTHSQKAANARKGLIRGPYKGNLSYGTKWARKLRNNNPL